MERKVYQELLDWKQKKGRKPLILTGARQVGKTWLMQEFGRREYAKPITIGDNCVIGGGSVVTKDIPDNSLAYGNPCRVIREI